LLALADIERRVMQHIIGISACGVRQVELYIYFRVNVNVSTHTHTHPFNGPFSRTTRVGRYQKGKTNLDFTEARDSE